MTPFTYSSAPGRVVFGPGTISRVADEIETLGCARAFVLSTPFQKVGAEALAERIGPRSKSILTSRRAD